MSKDETIVLGLDSPISIAKVAKTKHTKGSEEENSGSAIGAVREITNKGPRTPERRWNGPSGSGSVDDPIVLGLDPWEPAVSPPPKKRPNEGSGDSKKLQFVKLEMVENLTCNICMDILYRPHSLLPCCHKYCAGCFSEWMRKSMTCPKCRVYVTSAVPDQMADAMVALLLKTFPECHRTMKDLADLDRNDRLTGSK